jgi:hypothetical protein
MLEKMLSHHEGGEGGISSDAGKEHNKKKNEKE